MDCEICGQEIKNAHRIDVEGAVLTVCEDCRKLGKETLSQKPFKIKACEESPQPEIVSNFSEIIRDGMKREKLGITDVSKIIKESERFLKRIERGSAQPTLRIAKKLEKVLGVKLIELKEKEKIRKEGADVEITIGDIAKIKEK